MELYNLTAGDCLPRLRLKSMLHGDRCGLDFSGPAIVGTSANVNVHALTLTRACAEVRTFADCARYVLTTLMDLQATPTPAVATAFHGLFASEQPNFGTTEGSVQLLTSFKRTLAVWAPTLQKFLHDDDDQFELLLTLEEYCARRGLFEQVPGAGAIFVPIFSNVLYELYEMDIIREEVFLEWEAQKLQDDEGEQVRTSALSPARIIARLMPAWLASTFEAKLHYIFDSVLRSRILSLWNIYSGCCFRLPLYSVAFAHEYLLQEFLRHAHKFLEILKEEDSEEDSEEEDEDDDDDNDEEDSDSDDD